MANKYSFQDYAFQFVTITAGVLIALLVNGLVEWNNDRELVAQARATIAREIADNRRDLDATLTGIDGDVRKLEAGLTFANDMLSKRSTAINELKFHINLADLSDSAWRTAERTGALGHMDYPEVQRLSMLYDLQELIGVQQRELVSQMADVTAIIAPGFDPDKPNLQDVEIFRDRLMRLRAKLIIHADLAKRLAERYAEALAR